MIKDMDLIHKIFLLYFLSSTRFYFSQSVILTEAFVPLALIRLVLFAVVISQQAIIFWLIFLLCLCVTTLDLPIEIQTCNLFFFSSIFRSSFWLHRYGQWSVWYDGRIYLNGQRTFQLPLFNKIKIKIQRNMGN